MSAIEKLEQRLAALEAEFAKFKESTNASKPWWRQWMGAFQDDPYFEEAMRFAEARRRGEDTAKPNKGRRPK